jgi:DNA-binding transcriptional ArsR family regulator
MRKPMHPDVNSLSLPRVLHALSDPVRLKVVKQIWRTGGQTCTALNLLNEMPKSTASHHFRVLRESGIINMSPQGTHMINTIRKDDLDHCFPGLLDAILNAPDTE